MKEYIILADTSIPVDYSSKLVHFNSGLGGADIAEAEGI